MNIREFQNDLNNGMTLEKACTKHKITLLEAFAKLQYKEHTPHGKGKNYTGEQYIVQTQNGKYLLRKRLEGTMRYCGRYSTLEDAVRVRDCMIDTGWDYRNWRRIAENLGVKIP